MEWRERWESHLRFGDTATAEEKEKLVRLLWVFSDIVAGNPGAPVAAILKKRLKTLPQLLREDDHESYLNSPRCKHLVIGKAPTKHKRGGGKSIPHPPDNVTPTTCNPDPASTCTMA